MSIKKDLEVTRRRSASEENLHNQGMFEVVIVAELLIISVYFCLCLVNISVTVTKVLMED